MKNALFILTALLLLGGCRRDQTPTGPAEPPWDGIVGAPHLRWQKVTVYADTIIVPQGVTVIVDSTLGRRP